MPDANLVIGVTADLADFITGITSGTAAVLGMGVAVEKVAQAAINWQTQLNQIQQNTGATAKEMDNVSASIQQLATEGSASLAQLGEGMLHIENLGFRGAAATDVLRQAMFSATSTGGDTAKVANLLASVMHEYGNQTYTAQQAVDLLHVASQNANGTMEQFASASGRAIGIAANLGISLQDVTAAEAALSLHGNDLAQSQVQVVNMMTHMISPSKAAEAQLLAVSKASGVDLVSAFSATGLASHGLEGAISATKQAFTNMGYSQAQTTAESMKLIAAQRGGIGLAEMLGTANADYTRILKDQADVMSGKVTPTLDSHRATLATVGEQMGIFRNQVQLLAIGIGEQLLPTLQSLTEHANKGFGDWAAGIPGYVAVIMQGLGILVQGFGDAFGAILSIVESIGQMIYAALSWINPFATHSPSLVSQVTDGTALIVQKYTDLSSSLPGAVNGAKSALDGLKAALGNTWDSVNGEISTKVEKHLELLGKAVPAAYEAAKRAVDELKSRLNGMADAIKQAEAALQPYKDAVKATADAVTDQQRVIKDATAAFQPQEAAIAGAEADLRRLQAAYRDATQALSPFQDAVTAATRAVAEAERALRAAQASLRPFQDAVQDAAAAVRQAEAALRDAQAGLRPFEATLRDAQAGVKALQDQIHDATQGLAPYTQALAAAQAQLKDLQRAYADAQATLIPFQQAVTAAQANLQAVTQAAQDQAQQVQALQQAWNDAKNALQGYTAAKLVGEGAANDKIFAQQQTVGQAQLALDLAKQQGLTGAALKPYQDAVNSASLQLQILQEQTKLTFDPLHKALTDAAAAAQGTNKELTFAAALDGIHKAGERMAQLSPQIKAAQAVAAEWKQKIDAAKDAVLLATQALQAQKDALEPLKAQITAQQDAIAKLQDQYAAAKSAALDPLNAALDAQQEKVATAQRALDAAKAAIQPYTDAVTLAKDAQQHAADALATATEKLGPYQQAVDTAKLAQQGANDALAAAKAKLDPLSDAIAAQQSKIETWKAQLSDAKHAKLDPLNAALGDLQTKADAAKEALARQQAPVDALKQQWGELNQQLRDYQTELQKVAAAGQAAGSNAGGKKGPKGVELPKGAGTGIPGLPSIADLGAPGGPLDPAKFKEIADKIVANAQPMLKAMQDGVTGAVQPMKDFAAAFKSFADAIAPISKNAQDFGTWVQTWIGPVSGAVAVIVPLGVALVAVNVALGILGTSLGLLVTPLGLLLTAVGVFVVAWQQDWGGIRESTATQWADIKKTWAEIQPWLTTIGRGLGDLAATWTDKWHLLVTTGDTQAAGIRSTWDTLTRGVGDLLATFQDKLNGIGSATAKQWSDIQIWWSNVTNAFDTGGRQVAGFIDTASKAIIDGLVNGVKGGIETVKNTIGDLWDGITTKFKDIAGIKSPSTVFYDLGTNLIQGLINGVTSMVQAAKNAISSLGTDVIDLFKKATNQKSPSQDMHDAGANLVLGLANGINATVQIAAAAMSTLVNVVRVGVAPLPGLFTDVYAAIWAYLFKGPGWFSLLDEKIRRALDWQRYEIWIAALGMLLDSVKGWLDKISVTAGAEAHKVGVAISAGIAEGIKSQIAAIAAAAALAVTTAIKAAQDAGKIQSPSRLMHDLVGLNLGKGIITGLEAMYGPIYTAGAGAAGAAISGAGGGGLTGNAAYATKPAGAGPTQLHVVLQDPFGGQRELQVLSVEQRYQGVAQGLPV